MDAHPGEAASSIVGEPHPGDDEGPLAGTLGDRGVAYVRAYAGTVGLGDAIIAWLSANML